MDISQKVDKLDVFFSPNEEMRYVRLTARQYSISHSLSLSLPSSSSWNWTLQQCLWLLLIFQKLTLSDYFIAELVFL